MSPAEVTALAAMIDAALHREDCGQDCVPSEWLVAYTARVITMSVPAIVADERGRIAVEAERRGLVHFAADVAHGRA